NCKRLIVGMRALGFETFLPEEIQAPIIVTFHAPTDPNYDFNTFYGHVRDRGYVLYPGKLTTAETFRVGCIGHINEKDIAGAVSAVGEVLQTMNITRMKSAASA